MPVITQRSAYLKSSRHESELWHVHYRSCLIDITGNSRMRNGILYTVRKHWYIWHSAPLVTPQFHAVRSCYNVTSV